MSPARPAVAQDASELEAFYRRYLASSMFPLMNLRDHGCIGGEALRAMRVWVSGDPIRGAMGLTTEGVAMPQIPHPGDCTDLIEQLRGETLIGLIGAADQVAAIMEQLDLGLAPMQLNTVDPLFELHLNDLIEPHLEGLELFPLRSASDSVLLGWRAAYRRDTLGETLATAQLKAVEDVTAYMARDTHRVLFKDGQPVALTGFNASLPDVVQIGAVYVPPELRCNGYARAAVALQLLEARRKGVSRSILFAANEPAERAYRALGYRQIGDYSLVMFSAPQKIPAQ